MTLNVSKKGVLTICLLCFIYNFSFAQPGKIPFSTNPFQTNPFIGDTKKPSADKVQQELKKLSPTQQKEAEKILNSKKDVKPPKNQDQNSLENNESNENNNKENDEKDVISEKKTEGALQENNSEDKIYGMNFFESSEFSLSDKYILTPPPSYKLGPGDEVIINIWGTSEIQLKEEIGRDGAIYPNNFGKIYLQGLSFESAKNILINKFRKQVAPGSSIDVQIGGIRTIKVNLIGEIKKQGTITVSAFTTAVNALSFAGGVTKLGNLRKIQIIRDRQVINTIDLYEFIKNGGSLDDQYLEDGDIINVDSYEKLVKAEGSFKRPMFYQLKENEALDNLIELAGGPTFDARYSNIQIKSVVNETPRLISINLKDLNTINKTLQLYDGDIVELKKINPTFSNTIDIKGSVNYPDIYEVKNGDRLLDIIQKAGGLIADAYTSRAYVYRGDSNFKIEAAKVDLGNLTANDLVNNIELLPGDQITVLSKSDFVSEFYIDIAGAVRKPTKLKYIKNITLKDLLIACGGLSMEAESGRIEIASSVDSANDYKITLKKEPIWTMINIDPNLMLDLNSENVILKPYDKVYVRTKPDYKILDVITLTGEVNYPGEYPLLSSTESLKSMIEKAGGLKNTAFLNGATFVRDGQPIGIDFNDFIKNEKKNLLQLKNGDNINIPKKNELVKIDGAVITPISVFGDINPLNVKDYISRAGGFAEGAWKDRISVVYPNGSIKSTKRIFFVRKFPKVIQGCQINVPTKPEQKEGSMKWEDVTKFSTSILATLSTLVTTWVILKKA